MLIGLTIVAFATSATEATVSILASIQDVGGIAFENIIGSNVFIIVLVNCLIGFFTATHKTLSRKEGIVLIASISAMHFTF